MKRTALAIMLLLGTAAGAQADKWVFKDVSRPHGHARSEATEQADGHACGFVDGQTLYDTSRFRKCMRSRGWALARVLPDGPPRHRTRQTREDYDLEQANRRLLEDLLANPPGPPPSSPPPPSPPFINPLVDPYTGMGPPPN